MIKIDTSGLFLKGPKVLNVVFDNSWPTRSLETWLASGC